MCQHESTNQWAWGEHPSRPGALQLGLGLLATFHEISHTSVVGGDVKQLIRLRVSPPNRIVFFWGRGDGPKLVVIWVGIWLVFVCGLIHLCSRPKKCYNCLGFKISNCACPEEATLLAPQDGRPLHVHHFLCDRLGFHVRHVGHHMVCCMIIHLHENKQACNNMSNSPNWLTMVIDVALGTFLLWGNYVE
jgi:hypothetical protein